MTPTPAQVYKMARKAELHKHYAGSTMIDVCAQEGWGDAELAAALGTTVDKLDLIRCLQKPSVPTDKVAVAYISKVSQQIGCNPVKLQRLFMRMPLA